MQVSNISEWQSLRPKPRAMFSPSRHYKRNTEALFVGYYILHIYIPASMKDPALLMESYGSPARTPLEDLGRCRCRCMKSA